MVMSYRQGGYGASLKKSGGSAANCSNPARASEGPRDAYVTLFMGPFRPYTVSDEHVS